MKARIINGPRGVEKTVNWKDSKAAPVERRAIRNVDFVIGEDVVIEAVLDDDGEIVEEAFTTFEQRMARQRIQVQSDATARDIFGQVKARARELAALMPADPDPVDIDLD